ncbi:MAG: hypothetical protein K2O88_07140 [Paramuribaculum sp.]|nr:hypothetical protein [Paramuribaculum sp.]
MICLPILTLWLSNIFMTPIIFENITQQDTEQIEEALQHTPTSSSHKYHMYGTISDNTDIYMALDEPSSGMLQGELYIQPSQQQNSVPYSVSGTITTDGDVTLTITDPSINELQQWTGIAVTNPYGITAIKGTITQTSEKFYITRR